MALLDVYGIKHRSDLVSTFVEDTTLREDLIQHLKKIIQSMDTLKEGINIVPW